MKIELENSKELTDTERDEAVACTVRACAMCSPALWQSLAEHIAQPGVAIAMGRLLLRHPENAWVELVEGALRRTALLMEILSSKAPHVGAAAFPSKPEPS